MKKYKVTLSDKLGKELFTHNLYAKNRTDAESKAKVLLENVMDKKAISVKINTLYKVL